MKLLWTIANWKRTGPVGPSLDLASAIRDRGHDVRVDVGRPPAGETNLATNARDLRGLPAADAGARLHKHAFFLRDRPDTALLARWISAERPDLVVTTLPNDNRLALRAAKQAGNPPVARLWFADGEGEIPSRERESLLSSRFVFGFGDAPARRLEMEGVLTERVHVLGAPLDVEAFRQRAGHAASPLDVPDDRFLFGIVARIQTHRRWGLLWDALEVLRDRDVPFHLVVLGRGTNQKVVALRPVRERGLTAHVTFAGYVQGDAYAAAVSALDAQLLLVPGSDPTCRALREGMAVGVPSVATRRGLLPSIVADGESGILVDETATSLAEGMATLAEDRARARRMGEAARARADRCFAADRVASHFLEAVAMEASA